MTRRSDRGIDERDAEKNCFGDYSVGGPIPERFNMNENLRVKIIHAVELPATIPIQQYSILFWPKQFFRLLGRWPGYMSRIWRTSTQGNVGTVAANGGQ